MWGWALAALSALGLGYQVYQDQSTPQAPNPDQAQAQLFTISIMLSVIVSGITIYQFWKGR